jgi:hypothetical protein
MQQLQRRWAESESAYRQALEQTSVADSNQMFRAQALLGIGVAQLELGHPAAAEDWMRKADAAARVTFVNLIPLRADIAMQLGRALLAQKKVEAARESFAVAEQYWQVHDPANRSAREAAQWSAQARQAAAQPRK